MSNIIVDLINLKLLMIIIVVLSKCMKQCLIKTMSMLC